MTTLQAAEILGNFLEGKNELDLMTTKAIERGIWALEALYRIASDCKFHINLNEKKLEIARNALCIYENIVDHTTFNDDKHI